MNKICNINKNNNINNDINFVYWLYNIDKCNNKCRPTKIARKLICELTNKIKIDYNQLKYCDVINTNHQKSRYMIGSLYKIKIIVINHKKN